MVTFLTGLHLIVCIFLIIVGVFGLDNRPQARPMTPSGSAPWVAACIASVIARDVQSKLAIMRPSARAQPPPPRDR